MADSAGSELQGLEGEVVISEEDFKHLEFHFRTSCLKYVKKVLVIITNYRMIINSIEREDNFSLETSLDGIYSVRTTDLTIRGNIRIHCTEIICKNGQKFYLYDPNPPKDAAMLTRRLHRFIYRATNETNNESFFAPDNKDQDLINAEKLCTCEEVDRMLPPPRPSPQLMERDSSVAAAAQAEYVQKMNVYLSNIKACPNGWHVYRPRREFNRIFASEAEETEKRRWMVVTQCLNKRPICTTYHDQVIIPVESVMDGRDLKLKQLEVAAKKRSRNRFAMMCWWHPEKKSCLNRSSMPLTGIRNLVPEDDIKYLEKLTGGSSNSAAVLHIFDSRPQANAVAAKLKGGGDESHYDQSKFPLTYHDIANIHVMRNSVKNVWELVWDKLDSDEWLRALDETEWLRHIHHTLAGSVKIVLDMDMGQDSLVHCTDGWDRTAQMCSLAMLMMDPFYRTLVGFQVLIEKEWIAPGHKFSDRLGHRDEDETERSPIFLQFIDCVWQLMQQFPTAFEFHEGLLHFLMEHVYSCLFGTFLENTWRDRDRKWGLREQIAISEEEPQLQLAPTRSIWTYVNLYRTDFVNPLYDPTTLSLVPRYALRDLKFWSSYYCSWHPKAVRPDPMHIRFQELQNAAAMLKDIVKKREELAVNGAPSTSERKTVNHSHALQLHEGDADSEFRDDAQSIQSLDFPATGASNTMSSNQYY